jgi:hypothetical protein
MRSCGQVLPRLKVSVPWGSTQGTSFYSGLNLSRSRFQFADSGMECTIQVMKNQIARAIRKEAQRRRVFCAQLSPQNEIFAILKFAKTSRA